MQFNNSLKLLRIEIYYYSLMICAFTFKNHIFDFSTIKDSSIEHFSKKSINTHKSNLTDM